MHLPKLGSKNTYIFRHILIGYETRTFFAGNQESKKMGMDIRCGDYLTGTNVNCHPNRSQMALFLRSSRDLAGKKCPHSGKILPNSLPASINARRNNGGPSESKSEPVDIVELIRTTRTNFEDMIAMVRKNRLFPSGSPTRQETELEPIVGNMAHTFSNIFMAIQGRISLMLLRSGPQHSFFIQLKRLEKLVQSESILANDILPHISGRFWPLDLQSRRQLLEEIKQIPLLLGVKNIPVENHRTCALDSKSDPIDSYQLTVSITSILNFLLSEIHKLTDFMMSQTNPKHLDFQRLRGIKAYVQKGFDYIRDLYACAGLVETMNEPTSPENLVEIAFDVFYRLESSFRLNISIADNLWSISADAEQVDKIMYGLYSAAASTMRGGDEFLVTAANACGTDRELANSAAADYVVLSIRSTAEQKRTGAGSRSQRAGYHKRKQLCENDPAIVGIAGLIKSLGGHLSTICPPGACAEINIFMPAFQSSIRTTDAKRPYIGSKLFGRVIYLKSDPKNKAVRERIESCWEMLQPRDMEQDNSMQSSV